MPWVGLVDHLGQGRHGEVGQLDGLEAGPQALDRVEVGRVGGQALNHQPGPVDGVLVAFGSTALG
jgi:hypothetical protein